MEKSSYFISSAGILCIEFPPSGMEKPELCEVAGVMNETWFKHEELYGTL